MTTKLPQLVIRLAAATAIILGLWLILTVAFAGDDVTLTFIGDLVEQGDSAHAD